MNKTFGMNHEISKIHIMMTSAVRNFRYPDHSGFQISSSSGIVFMYLAFARKRQIQLYSDCNNEKVVTTIRKHFLCRFLFKDTKSKRFPADMI